ncbi:MAG: hypothetical protein RIQ56_780 [Candidatus Parcubacteria bacterium]|jgi:hypothetical protein
MSLLRWFSREKESLPERLDNYDAALAWIQKTKDVETAVNIFRVLTQTAMEAQNCDFIEGVRIAQSNIEFVLADNFLSNKSRKMWTRLIEETKTPEFQRKLGERLKIER